MPESITLNWRRVYALSLLTAHSKGQGIELIDSDHIRWIDYSHKSVILSWNEEQGRYFRQG